MQFYLCTVPSKFLTFAVLYGGFQRTSTIHVEASLGRSGGHVVAFGLTQRPPALPEVDLVVVVQDE